MKDMINVMSMNEHQRIDYIFNEEDDRTGKRFDWLNALFADIQTLIDGFKGFQNGNIKPSSDHPLGGGNLSVSILVCTGLELVSALYVGKTNYPQNACYNATDNVEKFICDFFPIHARCIPRLMWEGVRNGVNHLFIPNAMMYSQKRLDFKFVRNGLSQVIESHNGNIIIRINSIEFSQTLRKAINDYEDALRKCKNLQINFVKAWDSIKPKDVSCDHQKSKEVEYLVNQLSKQNPIDLLKI